nr:hypothetical protein [Tanacetum cinerariifolium]
MRNRRRQKAHGSRGAQATRPSWLTLGAGNFGFAVGPAVGGVVPHEAEAGARVVKARFLPGGPAIVGHIMRFGAEAEMSPHGRFVEEAVEIQPVQPLAVGVAPVGGGEAQPRQVGIGLPAFAGVGLFGPGKRTLHPRRIQLPMLLQHGFNLLECQAALLRQGIQVANYG